MKEFAITMQRDKATSRSLFYRAICNGTAAAPAVQNLYVSKDVFGKGKPPERITVVVSEAKS